MYAVIESGGKQYRVQPGESIEVETLPGEAGTEVEFDRVLAIVDGGAVRTGSEVAEARVTGTIEGHGRGDKTIVFKFKRKKQYKRTIGHRQNFTRVAIGAITGEGIESSAVEMEAAEPEATAPVEVEPAAVEPIEAEPAAVEPAAVDPADVEPEAAEAAAVEPDAEPTTPAPEAVEPDSSSEDEKAE